ncbi:MAG: hypothetical protein V7607_5642 [Solirubrobacteraceae bacterium]
MSRLVTEAGADRRESGGQVLARGLAILRLLVDARGPLTSKEIAAAAGIHQSSASRILGTLASAGYVRKVGYREFVPDYGVLALAERAADAFPLSHKPRAAVAATADECEGHLVSLAALWHGHLIYLVRMEKGGEALSVSFDVIPLHLSSPALRLLADLPDENALEILRDSRARSGWARPSDRAPNDELEALAKARELLTHDALVLDSWQAPDVMTAAIRVEAPGEPPTALAISGRTGLVSHETVLLWLQAGRRRVEAALRD